MNYNNYFQTNYSPYMPVGFPGGLADCGFKDTVSGCAVGTIPFGKAVVAVYGTDTAYTLPGTRSTIVVITGQFVASNSTAITFNGGSIGPVVFNTSHEQTLKDIVTLLKAQANVNDAWYTFRPDGTSVIEVSAVSPAASGITVFTTTGGASQPTNTLTQGNAGNTFYGVAQYEPMQAPLTALFTNVAGYEQGYVNGDVMNVLRSGRIYVTVEEAVNKGDPVYFRIVGVNLGGFRKSADSGNAVLIATAKWFTSAPANGIAVLQLDP